MRELCKSEEGQFHGSGHQIYQEKRTAIQADPWLIWKRFRCVAVIYLSAGPITHKITAASPHLMTALRSCMDTNIIPCLFVSTKWMFQEAFEMCNKCTQGVNFLKISEGIASLNHGEQTTLCQVLRIMWQRNLKILMSSTLTMSLHFQAMASWWTCFRNNFSRTKRLALV